MTALDTAILIPFALALVAPWAVRFLGPLAPAVYALGALATGGLVLGAARSEGGGFWSADVVRTWHPGVGVEWALKVQPLGLTMALLITGIGAMIFLYAAGYFGKKPGLPRLYGLLAAFMGSMVGVVTADDAITLFIFWELTSVTSYLLIGFNPTERARNYAFQALWITGAGGLILLAGLVLMGLAAGTFRLSEMGSFADHPFYTAILVLVVLGCATKSAQFPFHFWLPNAMDAPTPVSAYLHSATMVKAGVFLLARLDPLLGGTALWSTTLQILGGTTLVVGSILALHHTDLKKLLAYTTVAALGALTMLIGLAGTEGPLAAKAFGYFLVAHALYKGALFMIAGAVDHEAKTRDVQLLSGLRRTMPATFVPAVLAGLAMIGFVPFLGFLAKEYKLASALSVAFPWTLIAALAGAIGSAFVAARVVGIFWGKPSEKAGAAHEAPPTMLVGPYLMSLLGLGLGAADLATGGAYLKGLAGILGPEPGTMPEALAMTALALSLASIVVGVAVAANWGRLQFAWQGFVARVKVGPERVHEAGIAGLRSLADRHTRIVQHGMLRHYFAQFFGVSAAVIGTMLLTRHGLPSFVSHTDPVPFEVTVALLAVIGAGAAVFSNSRLAAVAMLGISGFAVAAVYLFFGAPDLAMTQLLVETLAVILFVLVFRLLPRFRRLSSGGARIRDAAVSLGFGAVMTCVVLAVVQAHAPAPISTFHAEGSAPLAKGTNVVNTILVDFRALDTFGEITVLALAALGVIALLRLTPEKEEKWSR